jgi:hypothetical protein
MQFTLDDLEKFFKLKSDVESKISDVARTYYTELDPRNKKESTYVSDYYQWGEGEVRIEYKIQQYDYDDEEIFFILSEWLFMDEEQYKLAIKDYVWEKQRKERERKEKAAAELAAKKEKDVKDAQQAICDKFWSDYA